MMMMATFARLPLLAVLGFIAFGTARAGTVDLEVPPGFDDEVYVTGLHNPTAMAFAPDGRLFIAEKRGRIRIVTAQGTLLPTPFATVVTHNSSARGLLGIAVDPNFATNGYVYIDYVSDEQPNVPLRPDSFVQRVVRLTGLGDTAIPGSERILLDDIPSDSDNHAGGDLGFDTEGMLLVSTGDGSGWGQVDSYALRALDLDSLNGKILRIDPRDGSAPPSNPFYAGPTATRSKVWCLGFRNPFHFAVKPGTSTLFVNDVGWSAWEEIDVAVPGASFGWPCHEGPYPQARYQSAFPGTCGPTTSRAPLYAYHHSSLGGCITGAAFQTSTNYPAEYRGNFFFADYVLHTIQRAVLGPSDDLLSVEPFGIGDDTFNPTDLAQGIDGDLYALNLTTSLSEPLGSVTRISWIGPGNRPPVARASATPSFGFAPLAVRFSSAGSRDPDGTALTYAWTFGDGGFSTEANPSHTYFGNGVFNARLTVSDGQVSRTASSTVTVGSRPPHAVILTPGSGLLYAAGDTISFAGYARDPDEGSLPDANLRWTILFHHQNHIHPYVDAVGPSGSFVVEGHGDSDDLLYFEIIFTATDSTGLSRSSRSNLYPAANLALAKPATASSFVSSPDFTGLPEDGNDNLVDDASGAVSGWHSDVNTGMQEWWQVDLGDEYLINRVGLIPRPDFDEPDARRRFRVLASDDPSFAEGTPIDLLCEQGDDPLPPFAAWSTVLSARTPRRYVRVQKTVVDEVFDFAEFQVFGRIALARDLAIDGAAVDLDPSDPDIDTAPGGLGQPVDVVVSIRNAGTSAIEGATLQAILAVPGTASRQVLAPLDDFDPGTPELEPLAPGASTTLRIPFAAGLLDGCGSYSLSVTHRPSLLRGEGGALGDEAAFNDRVVDLDVFSLDLAQMTLTIPPDSQVIEDPTTELLEMSLAYAGLGMAGERRDVRLSVDVTSNGQPVRVGVRAFTVRNVPADVVRTRAIYLDTTRVTPPLEHGQPFGIQLRLIDLARNVECGRTSTAEAFTIP